MTQTRLTAPETHCPTPPTLARLGKDTAIALLPFVSTWALMPRDATRCHPVDRLIHSVHRQLPKQKLSHRIVRNPKFLLLDYTHACHALRFD